MNADAPAPTASNQAPRRTMMPPHMVLRDFLAADEVTGLLAHALTHEAAFAPTGLGRGAINPSIRLSSGTRDLGPYRAILKTRILGQLPRLCTQLGMQSPDDPILETQLVAHSDGAFFKRHIDTQVHKPDALRIRVLSGVYYFHAQPKAFTGGALRLYAIGHAGSGGEGGKDGFVDIEPVHNSLLVVPAWAPHEVMPVTCRSGRFEDSRFAVNCWVHRRKTEAAS